MNGTPQARKPPRPINMVKSKPHKRKSSMAVGSVNNINNLITNFFTSTNCDNNANNNNDINNTHQPVPVHTNNSML
jgi:hypothetical protein